MTAPEPVRLDISIWSDVVYPWCPIGFINLHKALEKLADEVEAAIIWRPFQISADVPPSGRTLRETLELITGKPFAEAKSMQDRVADAGREAGFPIPWDEDPEGKAMVWNSFAAHKLLHWTLDTHGNEKQSALSMALFRANFHQQRNISELCVLLDIAEETGLDCASAAQAMADPALDQAVTAQLQRGRDMGLSCAPTLVINQKYGIAGGQPLEVFERALARIIVESRAG